MKNNVFSFDQPEENAGYLLWQVTMLWQRKMRDGLAPLNLTHAQFALMAALRWLSQRGAAVSQMDVAEHAGVDKMTASKILRALETRGLLSRAISASDTRARALQLSEQGEQVFEEALRIVERVDTDFFQGIAAGEAQFCHQLRVLLGSTDPL